MALRSGLYPHLSPSHIHQSNDAIKKMNLIIFDINFNNFLINNQLFQIKVYPEEEIDLLFDYITSGINDIYLFISNIISNIFIQSICEYPQIKSVYIFCKDPQYQNYSNSIRKFRGIFHDVNTMFNKFQNDINELKEQYYSEQNTFQTIDQKSSEVLWWKYFHQILPHIQHTNIAKEEFIAFAREVFQHDEDVMRGIRKFESSYTSDRAIHWYTRSTFVYRLVNQTLRAKQNFTNIFKLRFFLTDLAFALKTVHSTSKDHINSLIVYRGQSMKLEEVKQLISAVGNVICFNQFFSTAIDRNLAQFFAQSSLNHCCSEQVLFTIEIDSSDIDITMATFGNISRHSCFPGEKEILFSIYSTFRVISVQLVENNFYQIHLKLVNNPENTDADEKSIFNPFTDEIFIGNSLNENKQHIGFQLFLDMMFRLDQTIYGKQELLQYCRSKYQHDPTELQKINEFEVQYQSKDAVKWYITENFLYCLLNQPNHSGSIDCIVKMRYFIHDLHNELVRLQPYFIQSLNGQQYLTLYRSRTIRINQLNELQKNIGGLISIKSFLSATQNKQLALAFLESNYTLNPDEVSVIYEMSINTSIQSVPYAKIPTLSRNQEEILFSMGSIFRIQEVYERRARTYCVKLTMEHIEDELWNRLTGHLD
jgi:hypothetical protein